MRSTSCSVTHLPDRLRECPQGPGTAAVVVAIVIATGGSSSSPGSTLSLTPVQARYVPAIPRWRLLQQVALKAAAGYEYRLALETVEAPQGSTARTRLPLYMTLMARRGPMPFVTVQRLQLPSTWPWTKSSIVASFTLDPQPRRIRAGRALVVCGSPAIRPMSPSTSRSGRRESSSTERAIVSQASPGNVTSTVGRSRRPDDR